MKALTTVLLCLGLIVSPAFAHHAAEGIVDEELYAMIDDMVGDTPHAELTLDDLAGGMVEMTIETGTIRAMESMLDDGLLTYLSMMDEDVSITIEFPEDGGAVMTVTIGDSGMGR